MPRYSAAGRARPGSTTLISGDGIHPTTYNGSYDSGSSPYANNGAALSNVGYLLRDWLTVQKIAEVKAQVLDRILGDINGDGHVDQTDLLMLTSSWNLCSGSSGYDQRCDLNGDDTVNVVDLLTLGDNYGKF